MDVIYGLSVVHFDNLPRHRLKPMAETMGDFCASLMGNDKPHRGGEGAKTHPRMVFSPFPHSVGIRGRGNRGCFKTGVRLFQENNKLTLKLVSSVGFSNGVLAVCYQPI